MSCWSSPLTWVSIPVYAVISYLTWYFAANRKHVKVITSSSLVGNFVLDEDTNISENKKKLDIGKPKSLRQIILSKCPSLVTGFSPCISLPIGHLQTIYSSIYADKRAPKVNYEREIIPLPDGGQASVDWAIPPLTKEEDKPSLPSTIREDEKAIAVILHGLTGGSQEGYVKCLATEFMANGYKTVVFNSRGCAGTQLISPQLYTGAYTKDLDFLLKNVVKKRFPNEKIVAVGCSLGSNILTKYVGEQGHDCILTAMCSLANPFDFLISAKVLDESFLGRKLYSPGMTYALRKLFNRHRKAFEGTALDVEHILSSKLMYEFDTRCTCKLFGFRSADEYYRHASSTRVIADIRIPSLFLNSLDDPIAPKLAIPYGDIESNPFTVLAVTKKGGHLGWFSNTKSGKAKLDRWFPTPVAEFFNISLNITPVEVQCSFYRSEQGTPIAIGAPKYRNALIPDPN